MCRHHAAAVAAGSGLAEAFACPYHGWEYDTRGRLRKAPRVKGIRGFKAAEWGLRPIPAEAWGPFVFLWLGAAEPPPLEGWLGADGGEGGVGVGAQARAPRLWAGSKGVMRAPRFSNGWHPTHTPDLATHL